MLNADNTLSTLDGGDRWDINYDVAFQYAVQNGYQYFSIQAANNHGKGQGGFTNDLSHAMIYGVASNCKQVNGYYVGGAWSNAVYSTDQTSHYYVIVQDDGNLCVYRGSNPNDNQGLIWSANTQGKQLKVNPDYAATKGKFGQNWAPTNAILMAGDFIGSTSGQTALIMQSDGNLVLYTFNDALNCQTMGDGNMGGGYLANALYDIGQIGVPENVGKLAYIDQNSELHSYEAGNKTNTYSIIKKYDSPGYNIAGAMYDNATVSGCQDTCNNLDDCAGFAFQKKTKTCYPKTSDMYPRGQREQNDSIDIYIRNIAPIDTPIGVPKTTNYVDSVTFQKYLDGESIPSEMIGMTDYSGISQATGVQQAKLEQLQNKLNLLANQITETTNRFESGGLSAKVQMNKNVVGLGNYLTDLTNTDKQINHLQKNTNNNYNNILNDSDIIVLQKNYEYIFWSILAIGTVLISMNVVKR
jgi:hypothetical protein